MCTVVKERTGFSAFNNLKLIKVQDYTKTLLHMEANIAKLIIEEKND